jgi:hypothetical protein
MTKFEELFDEGKFEKAFEFVANSPKKYELRKNVGALVQKKPYMNKLLYSAEMNKLKEKIMDKCTITG